MSVKTQMQVILKFLLIVYLLSFSASLLADDLKQINMQEDWGVEPVHMRVTANGFMIEFRYKILDVDKAMIFSDRKVFPYLLSMKSKARLSIPYGSTVGFLKSNRRFIKKGKNYIAMFSNEGQHMLKGDKVKIQIKNQVSPALALQ